MSRQLFERLSYVALGIVLVLFILMMSEAVPVWTYIYIVGFSVFLLVFRLGFRIYFIIKEKK
jgi:hypothetical protein